MEKVATTLTASSKKIRLKPPSAVIEFLISWFKNERVKEPLPLSPDQVKLDQANTEFLKQYMSTTSNASIAPLEEISYNEQSELDGKIMARPLVLTLHGIGPDVLVPINSFDQLPPFLEHEFRAVERFLGIKQPKRKQLQKLGLNKLSNDSVYGPLLLPSKPAYLHAHIMHRPRHGAGIVVKETSMDKWRPFLCLIKQVTPLEKASLNVHIQCELYLASDASRPAVQVTLPKFDAVGGKWVIVDFDGEGKMADIIKREDQHQ